MKTAQRASAHEQALLRIVRTLPLERVVQILDYARYIESQAVEDFEILHDDETKEEIIADEAFEKSTSSLVIRRMTEDDLEAVERIERAAFLSPWSHRAFLYELKENQNAVPLVATIDGKICGYIVAWMVTDELHIGTVAVDESWRRRGIGSMLVQKIFEMARKQRCTRAFLEVRRSNEGAQKLYEVLGFRAIGVRPNYYAPQQEDAILMAMPLAGTPVNGSEEDNGLVQA
jgi:ribosomal-protein-alanine N-acetyltransferase